MATLADQFLSEHIRPPSECESHTMRLRREVQQWLKDTPVIVVSQAARFFFDVFWEEHPTTKPYPFPNVAPPFPCFWTEFHIQNTVSGGVPPQTVPMTFGGKKIGFYWLATDGPDVSGGWELVSLVFLEFEGQVLGPIFSARIETDPQGRVLEILGRGIEFDDSEPPEDEIEHFDYMVTLHYPALLAICFMNCANVRVIDNKPKERERRRFQNLYGRPPVIYKTLDIAPMLKTIAAQAGTGSRAKQALHIMRGHFKRFNEKLLFGKYKGTWWWPSQARGTISRGYVKKIYDVHPPKKE